MLKYLLFAGAIACALFPAESEARARLAPVHCVETGSVMFPVCGMMLPSSGAQSIVAGGRHLTRTYPAHEVAEAVVGGRPAGCPHAFCGCGASLHLFGRIIPSLNLAANWLRFPRASPAPRMAAARSGHVMVLEEHISGDVWLVHDSNSGGHATRLHARSIAGYTIVDPHGAG